MKLTAPALALLSAAFMGIVAWSLLSVMEVSPPKPVRPLPSQPVVQLDAPMPVSAETEPPAVVGGTATWCAPTPNHCQNWGRPAMLGAMASFRYGDRPYAVRVDSGGHHVVVTVVSHCSCGSTLIDLSVAAFERLAPLSRGRIPVSVSDAGPAPTLPSTSTVEGENEK